MCSHCIANLLAPYLVLKCAWFVKQVYRVMERSGIKPSITTFGTLITAASEAGRYSAVKEVWGWLERSNMEINTACMNAFVTALVKQVGFRSVRQCVLWFPVKTG